MKGIATIAAAIAGIGGGLIMLSMQSASSGSYSLTGHNFFETLLHGFGLFTIALVVLALFAAQDVQAIRAKGEGV